VKPLFLDAVWEALSERLWRSPDELRAASGTDESTFNRIINFLVHWDFVETQLLPDLHVKRKAGAISPTEVANVVGACSQTPRMISEKQGRRIAERVACRICGGRSLTFVGENQVDCTQCLERQWYTIDAQLSRLLVGT